MGPRLHHALRRRHEASLPVRLHCEVVRVQVGFQAELRHVRQHRLGAGAIAAALAAAQQAQEGVQGAGGVRAVALVQKFPDRQRDSDAPLCKRGLGLKGV